MDFVHFHLKVFTPEPRKFVRLAHAESYNTLVFGGKIELVSTIACRSQTELTLAMENKMQEILAATLANQLDLEGMELWFDYGGHKRVTPEGRFVPFF